MINGKSDVDTQHIVVSPYDFDHIGRKKIIINVSYDDFIANPLQTLYDNLGTIVGIHQQNVADMNYLKSYMKGKQPILEKIRANGDEKINNKHLDNHAWEFVQFKKGYYVGKPIKYVDLNTNDDYEDIKYFNCYNRDVKKASKDLIKYENMLITGLAYTMTIPKRIPYDPEFQSPYEYTILDNKDVCVVYSNDIYKTKLCSICFSTIKSEYSINGETIYTVYYADNVLVIKKNDSQPYGFEIIKQAKMPIYNCITEYQLNEQRMGVFEPVLVAMNSMNTMVSNQLDQLEEYVNQYLTFQNVDVADVVKNIGEFRRYRILVANTNNSDTPASIGNISFDLNQSSINSLYERTEQRTYDVIGVPMPTSNTGQGVSGEAQVYGGGWENAQTIAAVDTQYIMQYELEDLEKMIIISRNAVNSKTTHLVPTNMEIKYTINKSNNMMVKAQSLKYIVDEGFTREQALTWCEISDDPQTDGKIGDENYLKMKRQEIDLELEKKQRQNELSQQTSLTNEEVINQDI